MQVHEISNKEMMFFLSKVHSLGARSIQKIYEVCPNLNMILTMSLEQLQRNFSMDEKKAAVLYTNIGYFEEYISEYMHLKAKGIRFLTAEDEEFPMKLRHIPQAPMYLYQKGNINCNTQKFVAIVGSRNPSNYGKEMAKYISKNLAKHGVGIISGMATGVDAAAHKGAISAQGMTLAVLGCGLNICYPKENYLLYEEILASPKGSILSEYPPDTKPLAFHFPLRNRIISGIADIVVVVEAREKSGSLITVDHALEQGKNIYAVPGRVTDVMSRGCNAMIEMGANIFTSVDVLLENLCLQSGTRFDIDILEKNINMLANNEKMVYSCVDLEPKHIDRIVDEVGLSYGEVYTALLELELQGLISQISRNYYGKQF